MKYGMLLSDWSAISYQTLHSRAPVVSRIRGTIPTLQPGNEDVHRQSVPDIDIRGTCAGSSAVHAIQQQARINLGINYHCEFGQQVRPSMMRALLAKKNIFLKVRLNSAITNGPPGTYLMSPFFIADISMFDTRYGTYTEALTSRCAGCGCGLIREAGKLAG